MKTIVVTFAEAVFEGIVTFDTLSEARAYCFGFGDGASHYGAGMAGAYTLPDEETEMREHLTVGEVERALAAFEKAKNSGPAPN